VTGPVLLGIALVAGSAALVLAGAPTWLLRAYVGLAIAVAAVEAFVVVLPLRRRLAELSGRGKPIGRGPSSSRAPWRSSDTATWWRPWTW